MALLSCEECGKEISNKAYSCPNCGCPTEAGLDHRKIELANQNFFENQMYELITIRSILKFFQVLTVLGIIGSIFWIIAPYFIM